MFASRSLQVQDIRSLDREGCGHAQQRMPDSVVRHVVQTYAYYVDFCVGRKGAVRLATGADNLGTPVLQVVVKHGQRHLGLASAGTEDQRLKYLRRAGTRSLLSTLSLSPRSEFTATNTSRRKLPGLTSEKLALIEPEATSRSSIRRTPRLSETPPSTRWI